MRWAVVVACLALLASRGWGKEGEKKLSDLRAIFPAGWRTGPRTCDQLDPDAPNGAHIFCRNCLDPSDPASCDPDPQSAGAFCWREADRWFCGISSCGGTCSPLTGACTSSGDCCEGFCLDGTCQVPTCFPTDAACSGNADCCTNSCVGSVCASTSTTTTVTTTSSSTSTVAPPTSTTTLPFGGCMGVTHSCSADSSCCSGICAEGVCATEDCFVLDPMLPDDSNYEWWVAPTTVTLLDATCFCQGTCDVDILIDFLTRAGNQIDLAGSAPPDLKCDTSTSDSTYQPFFSGDADRILAPGRGLRVKANALSGGVDKVSWCIRHAP